MFIFFQYTEFYINLFFKSKLPVWWYDTENNLTHFVKKFKFIIKNNYTAIEHVIFSEQTKL